MPNPQLESQLLENRRQFFGRASTGIGTVALASLLQGDLFSAEAGGTAAHRRVERAAALRAEGQAGDLSAAIGGAVAG